jgi:hypothetical protein
MLPRTAALAATLLVAGCAGKLVVYDDAKTKASGIPFRVAEVYVKWGWRDRQAKATGSSCTAVQFQEILSLPTGALYFVAAEPSSFAKTSFSIEYNDAGGVKKIALDSDPTPGVEAAKAAGQLITALAPLAGFAAAASTGQRPAAGLVADSCDAGEANVVYCRLNDYLSMTRDPQSSPCKPPAKP